MPSGPASTSPSVQASAAWAAAWGSARATRLTPWARACSSRVSHALPALRPTTCSSSSPLRETTSRAWTPIEPVDPRMTSRRATGPIVGTASASGSAAGGRSPCALTRMCRARGSAVWRSSPRSGREHPRAHREPRSARPGAYAPPGRAWSSPPAAGPPRRGHRAPRSVRLRTKRLERVADDHDVEPKQAVGQQQHRPDTGLEILGGGEDPAHGRRRAGRSRGSARGCADPLAHCDRAVLRRARRLTMIVTTSATVRVDSAWSGAEPRRAPCARAPRCCRRPGWRVADVLHARS